MRIKFEEKLDKIIEIRCAMEKLLAENEALKNENKRLHEQNLVLIRNITNTGIIKP